MERRIYNRFGLYSGTKYEYTDVIEDIILKQELTEKDVDELIYEIICLACKDQKEENGLCNYQGLAIKELQEDSFRLGVYNIVKSNLAYWAGYYDNDTRIKVERTLNHPHSILGWADKHDWSSEELLELGKLTVIKYTIEENNKLRSEGKEPNDKSINKIINNLNLKS